MMGAFDGNHTVDVKVLDRAGNNATASVWYIVDTTAPSLAIDSPAEGGYLNTSSVTVSCTGSDAGTGAGRVPVQAGQRGLVGTEQFPLGQPDRTGRRRAHAICEGLRHRQQFPELLGHVHHRPDASDAGHRLPGRERLGQHLVRDRRHHRRRRRLRRARLPVPS